jgi:hypothetical protein
MQNCVLPACMNQPFRSFDEFFLFYLRQHSSRANRLLHACGTTLGVLIVVVALLTRHPWLALLWVPVGYGFAWTGHLLLEGNRPATWGHPWWSFLSDLRMLGLMLIGGLDSWLARAHAAERSTPAAAAQD